MQLQVESFEMMGASMSLGSAQCFKIVGSAEGKMKLKQQVVKSKNRGHRRGRTRVAVIG
jgi:hypothetical protein